MVNLTNLNKRLFADVASHWNELMPMMTMEECGELIQAISKYERFSVSSHPDMDRIAIEDKFDKFRNNLIEEIRDVYISLEALKIFYSIDDNELNSMIEKKLNKKY